MQGLKIFEGLESISTTEEVFTRPIKEQEEVLGIVPENLRQLIHLTTDIAGELQAKAATASVGDITELLNLANNTRTRLETIKAIFWAELQLQGFTGDLGIRKGWTVVRLPARTPRVVEVDVVNLGCGDPNCPNCGGGDLLFKEVTEPEPAPTAGWQMHHGQS